MERLDQLLNLNVNDFTEKKNGLTYLSWSSAWREFIKVYPEATYYIKKNENGSPVFGDSEMGYMVYTTVTVNIDADVELTHEMWLPILDFRNKAMLKPSMFDVNKSVMRCLTKNLAMFGLGLYIYAGEDLPETGQQQPKELNIKQLINNALNHPNVPSKDRDSYIAQLKAKQLEPNEELLAKLQVLYNL